MCPICLGLNSQSYRQYLTEHDHHDREYQAKNEQALAVRVLDRLVTGADEDAFESAENGGDDRPSDAREATKRSISNLLVRMVWFIALYVERTKRGRNQLYVCVLLFVRRLWSGPIARSQK